MFRISVSLDGGDVIVAALLLALSTFQEDALVASFEEIFLTFSSEEAAKKFIDEQVVKLGCHNSSQNSADVVLRPDFAGSENASRAIFHAINDYKDSLKSINRFNLVFPSEETKNGFIENVGGYIKTRFSSNALHIE
ncbi:hypothetical protein [Geitlerinema sp. PCC 7407]|uniref:hypothetical protein n=1 Tax=Geitlerinema sp. PCC 7407 TaxID=1173025 RepID=UPI0002FB8F09|nr:hypothetical protein [Geitlerinema sp. PCC 7407]